MRDHSTAIRRAIGGTVTDVERVQAELAETKARIETGRTTMTDAPGPAVASGVGDDD